MHDRRRLFFQPLQRRPFLGPFTSGSPSGNQRREHPVRLRRPVWRVVAGLPRGAADAGQELDFEDEAHSPSSPSPPSPSNAN